ncbi:MAG: hypothetical protein LBL66_05730 [Clostridiales bacterium]|jgi:G3E family GTPase|nr:hypothetical protein [Clostridiales bacterium]
MVKIDIVSGFLGAGKTTFVCRLLKHYLARGEKPAYIANEFGQTGLDAEIVGAEGLPAVEMSGGCVCCTLKDDAAAAVAGAIRKYNPSRIVFEPSGIFIFENFLEALQSPALKGLYDVGPVVTVVDGLNFTAAKTAFGSFVYNQIKNSPALVVSKVDRLRQAGRDADEIVHTLRGINPDAVIAAVPPADLDGVVLDALLSPVPKGAAGHAHFHGALKSFAVTIDRNLTAGQAAVLAELCAGGGGSFGDVCRVKGVLTVEGKPTLFNAAFNDAQMTLAPMLKAGALTFIGANVDEGKVRAFFAVENGELN